MPVEQLIYTDRPRGKGVDPARAGYQIKACSPGLSAEARRQLNSICMHYGDSVYTHAPRAAKDKETEWRSSAASVSAVPQEVLDEFPVIWSYDRFDDEQFALTRICYTGVTHDGRFGNFFAHSLVFTPDALAACGHNPLALSHANVFLPGDSSDETTLPQLAGLSSASDNNSAHQILRRPGYRAQLAAMINALTAAGSSTRPLLLCIQKWPEGTQLVEALTSLLPPSARCRTTFTTYESDRKWLVPTPTGARPANAAAAHQLIVLCGDGARRFDLRPDEYQSAFAVFNFVEDQFSPVAANSPYAEFAAACVAEEKIDRLKYHHETVEKMDCGADPEAWSALVPAAALANLRCGSDEIAGAAKALASMAKASPEAEMALAMLLPHVQRLAGDDDSAGIRSLSASTGHLINAVAASAGGDLLSIPFVAELRRLCAVAFLRGSGRTASAFLLGAGVARTAILTAVLNDSLSGRTPLSKALPTEDREAIVELLIDGLSLAQRGDNDAPPLLRLLHLTFQTAREVDLANAVWNRIGDTIVKPQLDGEWNSEKSLLLDELSACLPANQSPDAAAWLNLKLLETGKPQGDELISRLETLAAAAAGCSDSQALTDKVLNLIRDNAVDQQRAEALGRMAEAAFGTPAGEAFFSAYQDEMYSPPAEPDAGNGKPNRADSYRGRPDCFRIRRKLAEAKKVRVLSREMLKEVMAGDEDESWNEQRFRVWNKELLGAHADLLDQVRSEVAALVASPASTFSTLPFAKALLSKQQDKDGVKKGLALLNNTIVKGLPLDPGLRDWSEVLNASLGGLSKDAEARVRVIKFMKSVEQRSKDVNWSIPDFPARDHAWRDVATLDQIEKSNVISWCLEKFSNSGITRRQEAEALVQLLAAVEVKSADGVAQAVAQLLHGRDPVTDVLVATAFVECGIESSNRQTSWEAVVNAIAGLFDKPTRRLLEQHLSSRFGRRDQRYEERLARFCEVAGLSLPRAAPVAQVKAAASRPAIPEPASESKDSGLLGKFTRWLSRDSEAPKERKKD